LGKDARIAWATKGFEIATGMLPHQVAREVLGPRAGAVLSGPTFAKEVGAGLPTAMTVASVEQREIVEWDEFTGRFEAVEEVQVRARVGGFVTSVEFRDGAFVKTGDLLYVIDARPFEAVADQADGQLSDARAKAELAKRELDRALTLNQTQAVSDSIVDQRRQALPVRRGNGSDVDRALAVVRDEAAQFSNDLVWNLQLDGPVEVLGVESMTDNSVVIRTLLKTQPGSQWNVAREFRRRLINRFSKEAIESPFQQRRVHVTVKGAPPGEAVAAAAAAGAAG
jgi:hypothetical protein